MYLNTQKYYNYDKFQDDITQKYCDSDKYCNIVQP